MVDRDNAPNDMVFSSVIFLLLFLPVVLVVYHVLFLPARLGWAPAVWRRAANLFLLLVSLVFYFWGEQYLVWIVLASTMIDYVCGLIISGGLSRKPILKLRRRAERRWSQRLGLVLSICSNLAFLCYFKYVNFGVDAAAGALQSVGLGADWAGNIGRIALPLGISFYTFQSMSYTIDVYRGQVRATRNLIDFACYVTMFPQLVAGPIVRYRQVRAQLVQRMVSFDQFASGARRFAIGLGKKVLIANTVALAADKIFALPTAELTTPLAWLGLVAYTLQIFFDFSGYSDMAIGLGRMLGFEFPENFNYPYVARSIQDFWRRWHISLSTWFRDYLYIPLGGNRRSGARTYANLVTVFFLCGLWHGAAWPFVLWGLFHGLFLVIERAGLGKVLARYRAVGHVYALAVILCGWVLVRCETLSQAGDYFQALVGLGAGFGVGPEAAAYLTNDLWFALIAGVILSMPTVPVLERMHSRSLMNRPGPGARRERLVVDILRGVGLGLILLVSVMAVSSDTYNPFIYYRF